MERRHVTEWFVAGALLAFAIPLIAADLLELHHVPHPEALIVMATHLAPSTTRASQTRPLLGLRCMPGRLALAAFRMPLFLYRGGWGWMLGRTFLLLVHVGRRTGESHDTVAMVLGDDADTGELVICSAWGPEADWIRNLQAGPGREVRVGRQRFVPEHRFLSEDEAVALGVEFRARHPHRLWLLSTILGWGDLRCDDAVHDFVRAHPFVAVRPAGASKGSE